MEKEKRGMARAGKGNRNEKEKVRKKMNGRESREKRGGGV
jgi:hypothetical protein